MKTFEQEYLSADEIYERAMDQIVSLPCQESYARELAEIFSYHIKKNCLMDQGFSADELPQQSAVIVAPSGQGKSFLLRAMAKACGVNVVIIECSTIAHEGWHGISLSEKLLESKNACEKGNQEAERAFERSIILVDEVDKLRNWGTSYDQSNAQENFLQLLNGEPISYKEDNSSPVKEIETKRWTVLLAGAFAGLDKIIADRIAVKKTIGFGASSQNKKLSTAELMERTIPADLVAYGMMNELVSRIGTIISIHPMGMEDYRLLINGGKRSAVDKQARYLSTFYGVSLDITDCAVEAIVRKCIGSQTGARAVNPLIDTHLRKVATMLDRNSEIGRVVLDADVDELCVHYEKAKREKPCKPCYIGKKASTIAVMERVEANKEAEQVEEMAEDNPEQTSKEQKNYDSLAAMLKEFVEMTADGSTIIRSGTVAETVNLIYMLYEEAGEDPSFHDMLHNFLTCSVLYLNKVYPWTLINFSTLFRLAVSVQKTSTKRNSRFDKDVTSCICCEGGNDDRFCNAYSWISVNWQENTAYMLVLALNKVSQILCKLFSTENPHFSIEKLCFSIKEDKPGRAG